MTCVRGSLARLYRFVAGGHTETAAQRQGQAQQGVARVRAVHEEEGCEGGRPGRQRGALSSHVACAAPAAMHSCTRAYSIHAQILAIQHGGEQREGRRAKGRQAIRSLCPVSSTPPRANEGDARRYR
jgi:hypothetical protein